MGAVDRITRKIVLRHVNNRDSATLTKFIRDYIVSDSIVFSDCRKGYNSFNQHKVVNHSRCFVDHDSGAHTNTIKGN